MEKINGGLLRHTLRISFRNPWDAALSGFALTSPNSRYVQYYSAGKILKVYKIKSATFNHGIKK
jgi:hypothetical protein